MSCNNPRFYNRPEIRVLEHEFGLDFVRPQEIEKVYLEDEVRSRYDFEEVVGESPALKTVLAQVETVAPTSSTVLIPGPG